MMCGGSSTPAVVYAGSASYPGVSGVRGSGYAVGPSPDQLQLCQAEGGLEETITCACRRALQFSKFSDMQAQEGTPPSYGLLAARHLLNRQVVHLLVISIYGYRRVLPGKKSSTVSVETAGYSTLRQFARVDGDSIGAAVRCNDSKRHASLIGRALYLLAGIQV